MNTPLSTFEDTALIKLALTGHADSFAALMDRHVGPVKRRIGSMVLNFSDRDDLLQEVIFKAWIHLAAFRAESSFRTWITRVAVNEVFQFHRKQLRKPAQPIFDLDSLPSSCESPHHSLIRLEQSRAVRRAVIGLPAKYRQVLILHEFEQRSTLEISQSLRSSLPAVKTRLFRARLLISSALRQEGIESRRKARA